MSSAASGRGDASAFDELRQQKAMFDNTWMLAVVLAAAQALLLWYFRLAQVNIGPIVWTLATLALAQFGVGSQIRRASSPAGLRSSAVLSQMLGTALMGVSWHLLGGLQQPLFPMFMLLPLLPGALLLGFWQRQAATLAFLAVLASGVVLSPDTNSFIEERYGIGVASAHLLPSWIPRSRVAFADVNTSPSFDLVMMTTIAIMGVAITTTARALVNLCRRGVERFAALEGEVARLQELNAQLVVHAPSAEVILIPHSGRIVNASKRFMQRFGLADVSDRFLLDVIAFSYPTVIKRLMATGGEEIQGATAEGRDVVLRLRAEIIGSGASLLTALNVEDCSELCWRSEVDALDEPVFAVNSRGHALFLNKTALTLFGDDAEGVLAAGLFNDGAGNWWDIAPLETARRILQRGNLQYLASIRRQRIAASIGELSFVRLQERRSSSVAA